jgi:hypothetical protein
MKRNTERRRPHKMTIIAIRMFDKEKFLKKIRIRAIKDSP